MSTTARAVLGSALSLGVLLGCSSEALEKPEPDPMDDRAGAWVELELGPSERAFVELATPGVVEVEGDGRSSIAWDLALVGRDIFTNGGISGPGSSSAFGPLAAPTYLSDTAPEVPLMLKDRAGGALLDWYDYGGSTHQLFSRYHVYGLRDGERYFKLQILGYYGEQRGAPVPALYHVRYAEVTEAGAGETHELELIDATAGGSKDDEVSPSACLDLDSEAVLPLTPVEAAESDAWHVCFRRESISVNGGVSGPRGMQAVDLQAAQTVDETEQEIQKRTAKSEQARFDDTDLAALSDRALAYREDGVVTAFAQRWLDLEASPITASEAVWLVIGADGASKFLVKFSELSADPADEPATLKLEVKPVR
jgi:hypothetical protein